jgi:hypothetical protein
LGFRYIESFIFVCSHFTLFIIFIHFQSSLKATYHTYLS